MRKHRPGTFQGGHKKRGGRKKGTPNRLNRNLLEAMVKAAEKVGSDGRGKDGIDGYFERLAGKKEGYFVSLLRPAVQKQAPAAEPHENTIVYQTEQEFRQALLDRGVHPTLLPPPQRDPGEKPPANLSPPKPPPGWLWVLRRSDEPVGPETDEPAAVDTDEEAQMLGHEPTTEDEIKKCYGTPQHPAPGWEWGYNATYGHFYPVRIKSKRVV